MFLFHVIFLMVFLGVYTGRAMIWVGVNKAQESLVSSQQQIIVHTEILEDADAQAMADVEAKLRRLWLEKDLERSTFDRAMEFVEQGLVQSRSHAEAEAMKRFAAGVGKITPCLQTDCQPEQPVWRVLLRWEEGLLPFFLALGLIVYNLLRGWLTWWVGLLRDAEERTDHSPRLAVYTWPYRIHLWVMWPLFATAFAALIYNGYVILIQTSVILPAL